MTGMVRTTLARPLTFVVMAITILILGVLATLRMPVDIFPNIRVPVIAVAWSYSGLSSEEIRQRRLPPHGAALHAGGAQGEPGVGRSAREGRIANDRP